MKASVLIPHCIALSLACTLGLAPTHSQEALEPLPLNSSSEAEATEGGSESRVASLSENTTKTELSETQKKRKNKKRKKAKAKKNAKKARKEARQKAREEKRELARLVRQDRSNKKKQSEPVFTEVQSAYVKVGDQLCAKTGETWTAGLFNERAVFESYDEIIARLLLEANSLRGQARQQERRRIAELQARYEAKAEACLRAETEGIAVAVPMPPADGATYTQKKSHMVEAVSFDQQLMVVGGSLFKTQALCPNWSQGDQVQLVTGNLFGTCPSAKLLNSSVGQECNFYCQGKASKNISSVSGDDIQIGAARYTADTPGQCYFLDANDRVYLV